MIEYRQVCNAAALDTAANARVVSTVLELAPGETVGANIDIVEQTATLTGVLRIEVAMGDSKQRQREIDSGGDVLPWHLYGPLGTTVSGVTVTEDEIVYGGSLSFALKITPGFRWVRFVALTTAGAGHIDIAAGVG